MDDLPEQPGGDPSTTCHPRSVFEGREPGAKIPSSPAPHGKAIDPEGASDHVVGSATGRLQDDLGPESVGASR